MQRLSHLLPILVLHHGVFQLCIPATSSHAYYGRGGALTEAMSQVLSRSRHPCLCDERVCCVRPQLHIGALVDMEKLPLVMPPWQYQQLRKMDKKPFQPLDKGWIRPQHLPTISAGQNRSIAGLHMLSPPILDAQQKHIACLCSLVWMVCQDALAMHAL